MRTSIKYYIVYIRRQGYIAADGGTTDNIMDAAIMNKESARLKCEQLIASGVDASWGIYRPAWRGVTGYDKS